MGIAEESTVLVGMAHAHDVLCRAFARVGMPDDLAERAAGVLIAVEARGVASHGLSLAPQYLRRMQTGEVDPAGRPFIDHRRGAVSRVDGAAALGQLAALLAAESAAEAAAVHGVAVAAVHRSNHGGAMGHYARAMVERGCVGIVAATAVPSMRPPGGSARTLGNNPLAIAIPTLDHAIVLDMAMSAVARRKISLAAQSGGDIPLGWALDVDGEPTVDPQAALQGVLAPLGGVKGAALSVLVGMLASGLGGAAFGPDLGELSSGPVPAKDGVLAIAIDPAFFGPPREVLGRFSEAAHALRHDLEGVEDPGVRLPGDRSQQRFLRSQSEGLRIAQSLWRQLLEAAGDSSGH